MDTLRGEKMAFVCKRIKKLICGTDTKKNIQLVARLRCKKWDCTYCAYHNAKKWKLHLMKKLYNMPENWTFITVTCLGEYHHAHTTYKKIVGEWDKLVKRLKRYTGNNNLSFVRVLEQHKSGEIHAHGLIQFHDDDVQEESSWQWVWVASAEKYMKKYRGKGYKAFGKMMNDLGLGYMYDYSPVLDYETLQLTDNSAVLGYILKYTLKSTGNDEYPLPRGARKIITSRDLKMTKKEELEEPIENWELIPSLRLEDIQGIRTKDLTAQKWLNDDDFK